MSKRSAKRKFDCWVRYYERVGQEYVTPGGLRAYDAVVRADCARLNLRLRDEGANWRAGWYK